MDFLLIPLVLIMAYLFSTVEDGLLLSILKDRPTNGLEISTKIVICTSPSLVKVTSSKFLKMPSETVKL